MQIERRRPVLGVAAESRDLRRRLESQRGASGLPGGNQRRRRRRRQRIRLPMPSDEEERATEMDTIRTGAVVEAVGLACMCLDACLFLFRDSFG